MAKLTNLQAERMIQRQKKREAILKQKEKNIALKEQYGEDWKNELKKEIQKTVDIEIGSISAPRIYDIKDRYDFFNPIQIYRDPDYKEFKFDFAKFEDSEQKYKNAQDDLDNQLKLIDNEEEETKATEYTEDGEDGNTDKPAIVSVDGKPVVEKVRYDELTDQMVKIKETPKSIIKGKLGWEISTFFSRIVPIFSAYTCSCCGYPKKISEFYPSYSIANGARVNEKGDFHLPICKQCCQKMLSYFYTQKENKNIDYAMKDLCAYLNLYWDEDLFNKSKQEYDDSGRKGTLLGNYIKLLNNEYVGFTFLDSPFLTEEGVERIVYSNKLDDYDWSQEDYNNKKLVLSMVGYDPFEKESEKDKKILYRDLLNILEPGMENDFVKFQSGISIVKSFFKLRKMDERQDELERNSAPLSEQKAIADLKSKELTAITSFSRDSGFSERYASAKAKGEGTLTGIMRKMDEKKYENAMVNRYNIETSATIQQAADASVKSIMGQLSLSDAEVWKITQDQYQELVKLRREISRLQEDLRQANYKCAELNLKEKQRQREEKESGRGEE